MKKLNVDTLLLCLIGGIYLFVSLIIKIIVENSLSYWSGFGFFSFATVIAIIISLVYGNIKTTIKDVYFNAPIYYIGIVYFAISGIVSVLQMLFGIFSFKWLLVIQMIIFGLFVVYFVLALISKTNAENINQKAVEKNLFIRDMTAKLKAMANICDDRETKIKMESLAEEFQYSNPVFDATLEEIENCIKEKVAILDYQLKNNEYVEAKETIANIKNMIIERNRMAKSVM